MPEYEVAPVAERLRMLTFNHLLHQSCDHIWGKPGFSACGWSDGLSRYSGLPIYQISSTHCYSEIIMKGDKTHCKTKIKYKGYNGS